MASKSASLFTSIGSPGGRSLGTTLAAAEDLAEPFVGQAITLAALWAGQQQAAVIGFDGSHGLVNFELSRHCDPFRRDLDR